MVLFCGRFHYHKSGSQNRYYPGRHDQTSTKGPQYIRRGRKISSRTSYLKKDKMVSNGLQIVSRKEMMTVRQRIHTHNPITIRRKGNIKTPPQSSIQSIWSFYNTGWILQRTDKTTSPNNSRVGR